jgi:hypothetical protein
MSYKILIADSDPENIIHKEIVMKKSEEVILEESNSSKDVSLNLDDIIREQKSFKITRIEPLRELGFPLSGKEKRRKRRESERKSKKK